MRPDEFEEKMELSARKLGYRFNRIGENVWVLRRRTSLPFSIHFTQIDEDSSLVSIFANVMKVPKEDEEKLYRFLLEVNYHGLLHGCFALHGDEVVLKKTFPARDLMMAELFAVVASLEKAWDLHAPGLARYGKIRKF